MNNIRLAVFWVAISSAVVGGLAKGENLYHSDDHGYSITIPAGWQRVPKEIMQQQYEKHLSAKARQTVIHDVQFQLESQGEWFEGPFVLIQVIYYSKLGMAKAPHPDEFETLTRLITGVDIEKAKSDGVWSKDVQDSLSGAKIYDISADKAKYRYTFVSEATMTDSSKFVSNVTGFFGSKAIVQLSYNGDAGTDEIRFVGDWSAFVESFSFDVLEKYRVARRRPSVGEKMLVDFALYGIVAVVICIMSFIARAFSKRKVSEPE